MPKYGHVIKAVISQHCYFRLVHHMRNPFSDTWQFYTWSRSLCNHLIYVVSWGAGVPSLNTGWVYSCTLDFWWESSLSLEVRLRLSSHIYTRTRIHVLNRNVSRELMSSGVYVWVNVGKGLTYIPRVHKAGQNKRMMMRSERILLLSNATLLFNYSDLHSYIHRVIAKKLQRSPRKK